MTDILCAPAMLVEVDPPTPRAQLQARLDAVGPFADEIVAKMR